MYGDDDVKESESNELKYKKKDKPVIIPNIFSKCNFTHHLDIENCKIRQQHIKEKPKAQLLTLKKVKDAAKKQKQDKENDPVHQAISSVIFSNETLQSATSPKKMCLYASQVANLQPENNQSQRIDVAAIKMEHDQEEFSGLDPALPQSDPYDIKRSNVVKETIEINDSDPDIPACEKPTLIVDEKTWMTDHHIDFGVETLERKPPIFKRGHFYK